MQKAQREEAPEVTEPRGSLCWTMVDITLDSVSGVGCSWNMLPLVTVYISSGSDYITTIFSCVCIYLCKQLNRAPLSHISGKAHGFDLKQLMGVNTLSIPRGRNRFFLFCAPSDVFVLPFFVCLGWFGWSPSEELKSGLVAPRDSQCVLDESKL